MDMTFKGQHNKMILSALKQRTAHVIVFSFIDFFLRNLRSTKPCLYEALFRHLW
jgi:hypothetical protein